VRGCKGSFADISSQRFGRLTAVAFVQRTRQGDALWLCQCDCGNTCKTRAGALRGGHTFSCGCLQQERTRDSHLTHGLSDSKLYGVWNKMRERCINPHDDSYAYYGACGITVCEEWQTFEPFNAWATANGYAEGLTIERLNNRGNYEPPNCKWVPWAVQNRNKRNNIMLTFKGETRKLLDWADSIGISRDILDNRLRKGWSTERAFTQPVGRAS